MAEDMIERAVPGYPGYFAKPDGTIWSNKSGQLRQLKSTPNWKGYHRISVREPGQRVYNATVHALVALTFIGPRPSVATHVAHLNGNPSDNRLENLAYATPKENLAHMKDHGRRPVGEKQPRAVLTEETVRWARSNYVHGDPVFGCSAMARKLGVNGRTLDDALKRRTWRHVDMTDELTDHERDVILRFLNPEDEALVKAVGIALDSGDHKAREAIIAIRAHAQGEPALSRACGPEGK